MDNYLSNLRRRRKLVTNLVIERKNSNELTLKKQRLAVTYDQKVKLMHSDRYNTIKAMQINKAKELHKRKTIQRMRFVKKKILDRLTTSSRTIFTTWQMKTKESIREKSALKKENEMKERLDRINSEIQRRERIELEKLVKDAHAPRRKGTNYQLSNESRAHQTMFAASRFHHENKNLQTRKQLLNRINRGYDVQEKGREKNMKLLIRPSKLTYESMRVSQTHS
jgi:hypothetical protein